MGPIALYRFGRGRSVRMLLLVGRLVLAGLFVSRALAQLCDLAVFLLQVVGRAGVDRPRAPT
jgi:hypothetical protein